MLFFFFLMTEEIVVIDGGEGNISQNVVPVVGDDVCLLKILSQEIDNDVRIRIVRYVVNNRIAFFIMSYNKREDNFST